LRFAKLGLECVKQAASDQNDLVQHGGDLAQEQALSFAKVSNRDDLSKPLTNWAAMRVRRGFDETEGNGRKVRPIKEKNYRRATILARAFSASF
jgi:hypothetical protein